MRFIRFVIAIFSLLTAPSFAGEWQDLFNGRDLEGWEAQSKADWRVEGGAIVVERGKDGLLTTRGTYRDFELEIDIRSGDDTESGVLLASPKEVADPGSECYEVNIAPTSNAYPTGSLAGRMRSTDPSDSPDWRRLRVKVEAGKIEVWLEGKKVIDYKDRRPLGSGHIALQFKRGRAEFRNIRIKKLDLP